MPFYFLNNLFSYPQINADERRFSSCMIGIYRRVSACIGG